MATLILKIIFIYLVTIMKVLQKERYQRNRTNTAMLEGWFLSGCHSLDGCVNWLGVSYHY